MNVVPDTTDIDDDPVWLFIEYTAAKESDHHELPTPNFQIPNDIRAATLKLRWELGVGGWELTRTIIRQVDTDARI
jgi:hypothetical protein